MIGYSPEERRRYQVLGVIFLAVMVAFVAVTVGIYRKAFTPAVMVTLQAERIGTQLIAGADVKVRGVRVGEVRSVSTSASGASAQLALDPDSVQLVPANVTARLLPKTLFGERYVDLSIPARPAPPITAGAVIPPDRSSSAIEVAQVMDHLLPTLEAVRPAQLASTLGALSQALHGRGTTLGTTLVGLDTYLKGVNPAVPAVLASLSDLRPVTDTYSDAAPQLFGGLADLGTTSQTFLDMRDDLRRMLLGITDASGDLTDFLDENQENLVALSASARPTLEIFARYSPEFPCVFRQMVTGIPRAEAVFGKGSTHPEQGRYTIEVTASRGKYLPGVDTPINADDRGPRCYSQTPTAPQYAPGGPLKDGARKPPAASNQPDPSLGGLLGLSTDDTSKGVTSPPPADRQALVPLLGGDGSAGPSGSGGPGFLGPLDGGDR
ncbi:MCE family protein [Pseudonocardia spinosispora]|uniref:MCE family protein n=1 Tax=Pseudonocardia spinosispora TaxID=103441 RepID=UPI00040CFC86|nr:MCE family protein [Pseudonocardia spinosispora]